ncbi:hypothetical protein Peur_072259 [Populus x canadensis]
MSIDSAFFSIFEQKQTFLEGLLRCANSSSSSTLLGRLQNAPFPFLLAPKIQLSHALQPLFISSLALGLEKHCGERRRWAGNFPFLFQLQ